LTTLCQNLADISGKTTRAIFIPVRWGVKYAIFKPESCINELEKEGVIYRDSVERGRKSFTILILRNTNKSAFLMGHTGTHYGDVENFIDLDRDQVPTSKLSGKLDECLLL
jgi:hypothetical protein